MNENIDTTEIKIENQCGNPRSSSGEWNHSCTSELTTETLTLAA